MSTLPATFERELGRLDGVRRRSFLLALRSRLLSRVLVGRDARLAAFSSLHAVIAFTLSIYYPVALFVLAPVLLGVAHVAADVRYLVLRHRFAGWWERVIAAGCVGFVALAFAQYVGWLRWSDRPAFGLVGAWAAVGACAGALRARAWPRAARAVSLVAVVVAIALLWPRAFRLAYLHGHNLVALAVWPLFFSKRLPLTRFVRVSILAAAALLASGFAYRASLGSPGVRQFGLHVFELAGWLAPAARADFAVGITSAFVFLQAVHYSIWLSVIPQAEQPGQGTLSFRASARSLHADFGTRGLVSVACCMLVIILLAASNAPRAANLYMTLAMFHGYLELVLFVYFWVAREPLAATEAGLRRAR